MLANRSINEVNNKENYDCVFICPKDMIGAWPYLKFTYMASALLSEHISCQIIDPTVTDFKKGELAKEIIGYGPKIICVGVYPSTLPEAYQLIKEIRMLNDKIIIAVEGYQINADFNAVKELGADYGFRGDVELSFAQFCKYILNNEEIDLTLPGMVYYENNELKANDFAILNNLDLIPDPAIHLLPLNKYYSASTNKKHMVLYTGRGCPYSCSFCANPSQMKFRRFSTNKVIGQLKHLVNESEIEWIEFLDLLFTVNKKHVEELCLAIIENKLVFNWACQTRVDLVDKPLLELMKKAGCEKIAFGVESGSEKIRYSTGKKISNIVFEEIFELCHSLDIKTMAYFVMGHPNETKDDLNETISFSKKLNPFNVVFIRMIPLPDIEIFGIGVSEGNYSKDTWYNYMRSTEPHPRYTPNSLTVKELDHFYKKAFYLYYFRPSIFKKYIILFSNPIYFFRTIKFFFKIVFGPAKFSYC